MNTKVKLIKASNTGARNRNALHLDLKRVAAYCLVSTDSKDQLESYKSQVDYYTNLIKKIRTGLWLLYMQMKHRQEQLQLKEQIL